MQQRMITRKAYQPSTRRRRAQRRDPVARTESIVATSPQPEALADAQHETQEFGRLAQEADHVFDTSAAWW
jgi:hypothetical protein